MIQRLHIFLAYEYYTNGIFVGMKWDILISEEYHKWFNELPQKHTMEITTDLKAGVNMKPLLGRS